MKKIFRLSIIFLIFTITLPDLFSQILLDDPKFPEEANFVVLLSEGFNSSTFPPSGWSQQIITASSSWTSANYSANCLGARSAMFPFYTANYGDIVRLISPVYAPTGGVQDTLAFFNAYSSYPGYVDRMDIYTSTDSGTLWNQFITMTNSMITAPATTTNFYPTCNQWTKRTFSLPPNTNRIFFEARSSHGNNLYLDSVTVTYTNPLGIIKYSNEVPQSYRLYNNYPNPFNPSTIIKFDILRPRDVRLTVYDSNGKQVVKLVDTKLDAGRYEVTFNADKLAGGVYFCSLMAGNFIGSIKLLLIK